MSSSRSKPQYNAEASGTSAYSLSASLRSVPDTRSPPRRMVKLNERLHGSAELPTAPLAPSSRLAAISPPRSSRATAFYSTMHENADPGASMAPVGSRAVRRPAPISSTSSLASTSFESSSVSLSASSSSSLASAIAQQPAATASSLSRSERPRGHSRSGSMSDVDMKIRTPRTPHSASLAVAGSSRRAKSPGSPRSARPASSSTTSLSLSERHSHRSSRHSSRPTSRSHSPERAHGNENKSDHGLSPSEYSPDSGNSPKSLQARPPGIKVFQRIANEHAIPSSPSEVLSPISTLVFHNKHKTKFLAERREKNRHQRRGSHDDSDSPTRSRSPHTPVSSGSSPRSPAMAHSASTSSNH